ncbi:MAG: hypothetical protein FWC27_03240 [Firmicutes bacterium]|nr:hypothetical protein [Bacillota bacterium]
MSDKQIEFRGPDFRPAFSIPDGGNIAITFDDGEQVIRQCRYIDPFHLYVGSTVYHVDEFASRMARVGNTYAPETKPEMVDGYHIVHKMPARGLLFVMGHNPEAAQPWATWQGMKGGAGYKEGHFYAEKSSAHTDLAGRTCAHREGRRYEAYKPPKQKDRSD